MRHLLRKAALRQPLRQLRCAAAGEAPQHTLRVGQQLRRHARGAAVSASRVGTSAVPRSRSAPRDESRLKPPKHEGLRPGGRVDY